MPERSALSSSFSRDQPLVLAAILWPQAEVLHAQATDGGSFAQMAPVQSAPKGFFDVEAPFRGGQPRRRKHAPDACTATRHRRDAFRELHHA